jgi:hypothetical protein
MRDRLPKLTDPKGDSPDLERQLNTLTTVDAWTLLPPMLTAFIA